MGDMNTKYLIMIEGIPFKGRCDSINIARKPYNAISGIVYHSQSHAVMTLVCKNDDENTTACVEMIKDYIHYAAELVIRLYKSEENLTYTRIEGIPTNYIPGTNGLHIIDFVNVIELDT